MSRRARPVRNAPAWGDVATCAGKIPFFGRRTAKRRERAYIRHRLCCINHPTPGATS